MVVPPIPGLRDTDRLALLRYLRPKHLEASRCGFSAGTYTHGATAENNAYSGGVYSPTQNRIYFVPAAQADVADWHYVDCATGEVVAYTHGATAENYAYSGGVYSPTQNRIYFVPSAQADVAEWHYIQDFSGVNVSPNLMAHGLFNKF